MTRRRTAHNTSSSTFAIVAAGKGGVGKTTIATLIADQAALAEHPLAPFQVDDQRRLAAMLGARVHTILPDYELAMRSPRALTSPFAPLYNACAAASQGGPSPLLDVGPNYVELCTMWMRKAELGEDLATWGVKPVVFVPALAETESLRQAIETIRLFDLALPGATLAFVENQRDGRFADLRPRAETALLIKDELLPLIGERPYLTMPLIEGEAWTAYESHNLRFIKAMAMAPAEAAELLGEEIADVKIMRSAITAFVRTMRAELSRVLPFGERA